LGLRLKYNLKKPEVFGDITLRPAPPNPSVISQLIKAVNKKEELLHDILTIGQYDLSAVPVTTQKRTAKSTEKLQRVIKSERKKWKRKAKLIEMTSGTELFVLVCYYAIKQDILDRYDLHMYMEPEIIGRNFAFDYALIDYQKHELLLLVEVKRLYSLRYFSTYTEKFITKMMKTFNHVEHLAYHLHFTNEMLTGDYRKMSSILEGISRITERFIKLSIIPTFTISNDNIFFEFKRQLVRVLSYIIEELISKE